MKRHYLFTYLIDSSHMKLYFNDIYYCYSYCIDITIVSKMLQEALKSLIKLSSYEKNCYGNGLITCIVVHETRRQK